MNIRSAAAKFFSLALLTVTMASCVDDDRMNLDPLPDKTYVGSDLNLEYCGQPMTGKFIGYSQKKLEGRLETGSWLPLSYLNSPEIDAIGELLGVEQILAPGIIPGTPAFRLDVKLEDDVNEFSFGGTDATEYCTYTYAGHVSASRMELDITDVKLKKPYLAGTSWQPAPLERDGFDINSSPLHIIWKTKTLIQVDDMAVSPAQVLALLSVTPLIPVPYSEERISLAEAVSQVVRTIGFKVNGNVIVNYVNTSFGAEQLMTLPQTMLQYVTPSENDLKLYINPFDLYAQIIENQPASRSTRAVDWESILVQSKGFLQKFADMLSTGYPMRYIRKGDSLVVYFNSEFLLPLFESYVPLLAEPEIESYILEAVDSDPQLKPYHSLIESAMKSFPSMVEGTYQVEIGLNLKTYKNQI